MEALRATTSDGFWTDLAAERGVLRTPQQVRVGDVNEQHFLRRASQPIAWQQAALSLLASANDLLEAEIGPLPESFPGEWSWSSGGSVQPQLLLYGVAVENLLKAIRVAQGVHGVVGTSLNPDLRTHELWRYANDAGFKPDKAESKLLRKLQDVIESGKYPVAKKPGQHAAAWSFDYPSDIAAIWALLERLDAMLRATGATCVKPTNLRTLTRRRS